MKIFTLNLAITSLLTAQTAHGFSSISPRTYTKSITALHSFAVTEEQYPRFLSSASLCANSDSCSIDDAESYLREIVRIESGCAAGTMSGDAVCRDVVMVSDVVARLRQKVREGAVDAGSNAVSPLTHPWLAIALLYTVFVVSMLQSNESGTVPFTLQEVWWAIRDGYAADMMAAWFKHGGLVVSDPVGVVPFTPQEVWWSVQDGYAADLMGAWLKNGGLVGSDELLSGVLTPREVWWGVRDGYVSNVL